MCEWRSQVNIGCFSQSHSTFFSRQSLNLELADSAILSGQQSPGFIFSDSHTGIIGACCCTLHYLKSGCGSSNSGSHVYVASPLSSPDWASSPGLPFGYELCLLGSISIKVPCVSKSSWNWLIFVSVKLLMDCICIRRLYPLVSVSCCLTIMSGSFFFFFGGGGVQDRVSQ